MKRIAICVAVALLFSLAAAVPSQAAQPELSPAVYGIIILDELFGIQDAVIVRFEPYTGVTGPCFVAWWTEGFVEREQPAAWALFDLGVGGGQLNIWDDGFVPDPGPKYDIFAYYLKIATMAPAETMYGEAIAWEKMGEQWFPSGPSYLAVGFKLPGS